MGSVPTVWTMNTLHDGCHDDKPDNDVPDGDELARLLAQRWPLEPGEVLSASVDPAAPRIDLHLVSPRHRYSLGLKLTDIADGADRWSVLVDATDALFGQLIESGRTHRSLPTGVAVTFQGGVFEVTVEHAVPELEKLADQLLGEADED